MPLGNRTNHQKCARPPMSSVSFLASISGAVRCDSLGQFRQAAPGPQKSWPGSYPDPSLSFPSLIDSGRRIFSARVWTAAGAFRWNNSAATKGPKFGDTFGEHPAVQLSRYDARWALRSRASSPAPSTRADFRRRRNCVPIRYMPVRKPRPHHGGSYPCGREQAVQARSNRADNRWPI